MTTLVLEEEQVNTSYPDRLTQAAAAAFCPQCFSDQVAASYDGGVYCLECNQHSASGAVRR